jgi:anti-anti-sigma regulatory factor
MLRITEQYANGRLVLKLEGRFSAPWVGELDACWRAAMDAGNGTSIWIDLSDVYVVDVAGQEQLARMHRAGVRFLTRGCVMRELVREISESADVATER